LSTKLSKDDVKNPDQVLKTLNQGFQWTQAHSTMMIAAIAAFLVLGVGVSIFTSMSEKKETQAQASYGQFEKTYLDKKRGFEEAIRDSLKPNPLKEKDPKAAAKAVATGDIEKDYGTEVAGFNKVIAENGGTKAAQMAALSLSEIYLNYKKTDEAYQALQKVEPKSHGNDLISYVVLTQYGNVLSEKNDCKGAVDQWGKVLAHKEALFLHDTLRIKSALCYEKMNDLGKAEELYKKVSQNSQAQPESAGGEAGLSKDADKYLRLLKLKQGSAAAKGS
jgi:predicted negative regulator of RcsB-dependent stress response